MTSQSADQQTAVKSAAKCITQINIETYTTLSWILLQFAQSLRSHSQWAFGQASSGQHQADATTNRVWVMSIVGTQ